MDILKQFDGKINGPLETFGMGGMSHDIFSVQIPYL